MEAITIQKYMHKSPRKLRLVADMVRKMEPSRALVVLKFTPQAAAKEFGAAIKTALGNAKQLGMEDKNIVFKSIEINEGPRLKRHRAGARGRVKLYQRKMSHIKLVLTDEITEQKAQIKESKKDKVAEKTAETKSKRDDELAQKEVGQKEVSDSAVSESAK